MTDTPNNLLERIIEKLQPAADETMEDVLAMLDEVRALIPTGATMTSAETAQMLGIKEGSLRMRRTNKRGPKYRRNSRGHIIYNTSDVLDYISKGYV